MGRLPSKYATIFQSQLSIYCTSASFVPSDPIPSPSARHCPSVFLSRLFLLAAPSGTGRRFVTGAIPDSAQLQNMKFIVFATLIVVAQVLFGGRAAHSICKIPVLCSEADTCHILIDLQLATDLQILNIVIWDEVLMCPRYFIDAAGHTIKDLTGLFK